MLHETFVTKFNLTQFSTYCIVICQKVMIDGLLWNVDKKKQGRFGVYILIGRQTVHSLKIFSPSGSSMNFQMVSKRNQQYQVLATSLYFDRLSFTCFGEYHRFRLPGISTILFMNI